MKNSLIGGLAATALGLCTLSLLAGGMPAGAQGTLTAQEAIHQIKADYGVVIIPRNGVNLDARVSANAVSARLGPGQAISRIASDMNARSRKVYIVLPASGTRPVTRLADARRFEESPAQVTLQLTGVPAADAMRAVARADNALLDLRADVGDRKIDIDGSNLTVADAIAQIADQTNTHWVPAYEIMPRTEAEMARAGQFHRSLPTVTINSNGGPTGPVWMRNAPPTPPAAPAGPSTTQEEANAVTGSNATVDQSTATPTVPADQAPNGPNPYMGFDVPPYYMMQNGYAYTPFGTPYPDAWGGWTSGGFSPSPGFYLGPGFGYGPGFGFGTPYVFGGGTSTTAGF